MKNRLSPIFAIFISAAFLYGGSAAALEDDAEAGPYHRIISLAPSITEVLFALGLGDRVVGVTRFCRYPPEAAKITKVGGYFDPNYEEIVSLKPDLVVVTKEHTTAKKYLHSLRIGLLEVDQNTIDGIVHSILTIGNSCGRGPAARKLVDSLSARIDRIRSKTRDCLRPRILVSVGRSMDSFDDIYIAGKNTFYDEMIGIAGGVNAYTDKTVPFPLIWLEGLYRLNPQIIIDLIPDLAAKEPDRKKIMAAWDRAATLDAVRNKRVYLLDQDYTVIPGPRFILTLERMARVIHPELPWN